MKSETLELYKKYRRSLFIISNERFNLFNLDENTLDYQNFRTIQLYNFHALGNKTTLEELQE